MDDRIERAIGNLSSFGDLAQMEANIAKRNVLTASVRDAVRRRSADLGRRMIEQQTGLDLRNLTVAEEKIVRAVSEYVGVMKRRGKHATRTMLQLKNRGLLGAAEAAVSQSKPTQGYQTLADEDLKELSYEQIIVDHPGEFSARGLWYARRTLGLPNKSDRPPTRSD